MLQELVIIGGGYAFWEINELINDINKVVPRYNLIGILDDNPDLVGRTLNGIPVLGGTEKAMGLGTNVKFVFAIGSFRTRLVRKKILQKIKVPINRFETLIHPTAKIFSTASIGHGCIIHYGTIIFHKSAINNFSIIAANCVVAVENIFGEGVLLGSSITTTTGVKIGSFSFIGSGTCIGENVEIGPGAQIGMGSLVLKNIVPGAFVLGTPPKLLDRVVVPEDIIMEWDLIKSKK